MKKIRLIVVCAGLFFLLSGMAWVKIYLLQPALISLPQNIKTIAIIDRTLQSDDVKNRIEKVLTVENFKQDEQAIKKVTEGIIDACSEFGLYNLQPTSERFIGGGTKNSFPKPLSGNEVTRLCEKHKADAILSIEIFDTDFLITNPVNVVQQVEKIAGGNPQGYNVSGVVVIYFGIKVYDLLSKKVVDEFQVTHRMNYDAGGSTIRDVVNQAMEKVEVLKQASYDAGGLYGERISPTYYAVTREFYNKPKKSNNLRVGVRKSEVADWKGAIESWKLCLNEKRKIAGRAALNIAVGYEVLGDLEQAKEWARKSYIEYNEKMANDYYNALVRRIREEEIIKRQVPGM